MVNLSFRIPDELRDDFSYACKAEGVTGSAILRQCMENYVADKIGKQSDNNKTMADRDAIVSYKITSILFNRFDMACKKKCLNKSAVVRSLIEEFCDKLEKEG